MKVTNVNVKEIVKEGSRLKGLATVILDDEIAIHDIRIIEGENGLFMAMPSRKTSTGGYADIVHPITMESRKKIEEILFENFKKNKEE